MTVKLLVEVVNARGVVLAGGVILTTFTGGKFFQKDAPAQFDVIREGMVEKAIVRWREADLAFDCAMPSGRVKVGETMNLDWGTAPIGEIHTHE